jgi:hypothetical protein
MRHARDEDLDRIDGLLDEVRTVPGLKEKKRGVFYLKSKGFLHFHEDPAGMFADLSGPDGKGFERLDVTEAAGQRKLMTAIRRRMSG